MSAAVFFMFFDGKGLNQSFVLTMFVVKAFDGAHGPRARLTFMACLSVYLTDFSVP